MAMVPKLLMSAFFACSTAAALAAPVAPVRADANVIAVQYTCIGPECLSANPLRPPNARVRNPIEYPAGSVFRRQPAKPKIKIPTPQINTNVPVYNGSKPLVRSILPKNTTYPATGLSAQHVQWCFSQYRSYRQSDNTFQPFSGQRKQCRSPFM